VISPVAGLVVVVMVDVVLLGVVRLDMVLLVVAAVEAVVADVVVRIASSLPEQPVALMMTAVSPPTIRRVRTRTACS
jgi:hypothetical protein